MTHIYFDSDSIDWGPYLRQQQVGEGLMMGGRNEMDKNQIYRGIRYMRGYGIGSTISSIGRFLLPIAKNVMDSAKGEATAALGRVHSDIIDGKPLGEVLKRQGKTAIRNLGDKLQQCGKGKRSKRKIGKHVNSNNIPIGENIDNPITSGPHPNPLSIKRQRKRKKDYLDL